MTPVHIERIRNTLGGIKARSCRAHCTPRKTTASAKAPTRSPMMVADFHGFVWPPHWRASRRQTIAPMNRTQPTGSMEDNLVESGSLRFSLLASLTRRKILSATRTTKPIGTFLGCLLEKIDKDVIALYTHPKAPPPSAVLRERSSKRRARTRCDGEDTDHHTHVHRSFLQRHDLTDYA